MTPAPVERKSWGPLIATIDLLFLVVAFFTLLLFYVQKDRHQATVRLNQVEESLAAAMPQNQSPEQRGNALVKLVDRLMVIQKEEKTREQQAADREERHHMRATVRVNYQVLPGGRIVYEGHTYTPQQFKAAVIDPARKSNWLAIRATASPQTPFGEVVAMRKLLLDNGGEFDSYWDNLTDNSTPAGSR
jgi:hypothetical protein